VKVAGTGKPPPTDRPGHWCGPAPNESPRRFTLASTVRAVGIECVGLGAEQLRVAVPGDQIEDHQRILRDRQPRDARVLFRAPLRLRRRRAQPKRLLDHALGEEDVGRRAIDLGDPAGRREHEIERVDQRLRARVRSTLQVGGDLAHDPAVVGELH